MHWVDTRHKELRDAKKELANLGGNNKRGPKDGTYSKYRWYAGQLTLLEAINNFELFYKQTLIALASTLKEFIPPSNIKGEVDAKVLWSMSGEINVASLLFEHKLFHNLESVDNATYMLIGERRYNVNNPKAPLKETIKAVQAIFQVRHTLSHNGGLITRSDSTKFKVYGYDTSVDEVIDPAKQNLDKSILRVLRDEATNFTKWLRERTVKYLKEAEQRNLQIPQTKREALQNLLGGEKEWDKISWSE